MNDLKNTTALTPVMHGLKNHSATSFNQAIGDFGYYFFNKFWNVRGEPSPAMIRGIASEDGICAGLKDLDLPVEDAINIALRAYDEKLALSSHPSIEKERAGIDGYVTHGLQELRQYGEPSNFQQRISINLEGVALPIIGYTDVEWDQHGIICDIKTAARMPSVISPAHKRQGAIYHAARHNNYDMRFLYIKPTPGKDGRAVSCYSLDADDARQSLEECRQVAMRIERFLALSDDKEELASYLIPDFSNFYWNNDAAREKARQVFGW